SPSIRCTRSSGDVVGYSPSRRARGACPRPPPPPPPPPGPGPGPPRSLGGPGRPGLVSWCWRAQSP
ncbi:hypothetical protein, partial [Nocardia abscessus]|uniref:hypothetical protein n=1 Tax=Nocardia abscessus TaxID=120957 RepID=UPI002453CF9A